MALSWVGGAASPSGAHPRRSSRRGRTPHGHVLPFNVSAFSVARVKSRVATAGATIPSLALTSSVYGWSVASGARSSPHGNVPLHDAETARLQSTVSALAARGPQPLRIGHASV